MGGWMDGLMDGWMDGWMDKKKDGLSFNVYYYLILVVQVLAGQ